MENCVLFLIMIVVVTVSVIVLCKKIRCAVSKLYYSLMSSVYGLKKIKKIRGYEQTMNEEVMASPKKRPFCNAFTGCGRKRSIPNRQIPEIVRQRQYVDEDSFVPLMDSDNAIEELSRQILSEAKLWEAIQEASAEIARRKQKEAYRK